MNSLPRLILLSILAPLVASAASAASVVTIKPDASGKFILQRDGQPYFVNGAGGTSHLADLVKLGGNSIRTWGIESLEQKVDGKPLLDRCQELGLSVTVGIWVGHERHGFNYSDQAQIKEQRDKVREAVRKYKDHPAVLIWGLGNEMEGPTSDGKDNRIWKELNELAKIIKREDRNHPVMTVIASAQDTKIKGILENYPEIDILGVNAYGGASGVARGVKAVGWKKPFILTEFGPLGHWEVGKTAWGAPIEPSSQEKAASYYAIQSLLTEAADICLGSYVFLWGNKQEVTSTWYGMFLASGEKLPTVDAMSKAWTGQWPANRCPRIRKFETALKEATVKPGETVTATIEATDPENDPLTFDWKVTEESQDRKIGGDKESAPPSHPECIISQQGGSVTIKTPSQPGAYRLFVIVRDGKGSATADNYPFQVSR